MPAIGKHSTAVVDEPWDGPGNVARLRSDESASYYRKMFAWVDPEADPETKGAYKFPHHKVGQDGSIGAANVRGAIAGIGVLNGARGGADIPAGDRVGVWNHLAAHVRAADMEPAELKRATDGGSHAKPPRREDEMPGMLRERIIPADELRVVGEGKNRKITGLAVPYGAVSEELFGGWRERIADGAAAESIVQDDIRFVLNHDPNYVFGRSPRTLRLWEESEGVRFENEPPDAQWVRDRILNIERGDIDQMSFRFWVPKGGEEIDEKNRLRTVNRLRLRDITLATFPAYPQSQAYLRSLVEREGLSPEMVRAALDGDVNQTLTASQKAAIAEAVRIAWETLPEGDRRRAPTEPPGGDADQKARARRLGAMKDDLFSRESAEELSQRLARARRLTAERAREIELAEMEIGLE